MEKLFNDTFKLTEINFNYEKFNWRNFSPSLNKSLLNITNHKLGHPFHLVTPSPWPILTSFVSFIFLIGVVAYMHRYINGGYTLVFGLFFLLFCMGIWWRDVIRESTWQGNHTFKVQRGLRIGFALFILSEVMFFFFSFLGIFS